MGMTKWDEGLTREGNGKGIRREGNWPEAEAGDVPQ